MSLRDWVQIGRDLGASDLHIEGGGALVAWGKRGLMSATLAGGKAVRIRNPPVTTPQPKITMVASMTFHGLTRHSRRVGSAESEQRLQRLGKKSPAHRLAAERPWNRHRTK